MELFNTYQSGPKSLQNKGCPLIYNVLYQKNIKKRTTILFCNHLKLHEENKIIILKNKDHLNYKINRDTSISKGKIRRNLFLSSDEIWKVRLHKSWKGNRVTTKYSFKKVHSSMAVPKKVWVYGMVHSSNYSCKTRWLVKIKWKK